MSDKTFHDGRAVLLAGDCLDRLKELPDRSVDSVVTDPPYHLTSIVKRFGGENAAPAMSAAQRRFAKTGGADRKPGSDQYGRLSKGFMGKQWDGGDIAFRVELWAECWRVLKPGGHLIAFSGSRTYHRMVVAIEDAGFEVRDQLMWLFGAGFPKSHDVSRKIGDARCSCQENPECHMRPLRSDDVSEAFNSENERREVLHESVPQQGAPGTVLRTEPTEGNARSAQSGLEGRRDISEASRQLREREVRAVSGGVAGDGAEGRLRDGAPLGDGNVGGASSFKDGGRSPLRSQPVEQSARQSGALAGQQEPQTGGAWPLCERCGKPIIPDGWGTALKPAHEPICLGRKPLIGTVAENVLAHRTGAINIDGCRVPTADVLSGSGTPPLKFSGDNSRPFHDSAVPLGCNQNPAGRHPANVVHDGSPEVVGAFPAEAGAQRPVRGNEASEPTDEIYGVLGRVAGAFHGDTGSAARFFYSAKADRNDRIGSKHPTVKPVDLMRWLVRLITPPGGTVLDPFAGTGTTGHGALLEGFKAIMVEREPEYQADIARRMALVFAGETERAHAIIKARGEEEAHDTLPLFGGNT